MLALLKNPFFQKLLLALVMVVAAARVHWGLGLFVALVAARGLVATVERPVRDLIRQLRSDAVLPETELASGLPEFSDLTYWMRWKLSQLQQRDHAADTRYRQALNILDELNEGVLVLGGDKRILFINRPALNLLSITAAQAEGRTLVEVMRDEPVNLLVERVLNGETVEAIDMRVEAEAVRMLQVVGALFRHGDRQALLVLRDVTALRQTEQIRKDFVSNVSHELKTPLMAISVAVETLIDGALSDPQHNMGFLKTIAHHTERLQYLIRDILTLSKIENALPTEEMQSLNLAEVLSAALADMKLLAQQRCVTLPVEPVLDHEKADAVTIRGRASELRQVFINLIENAIRYTPAGGQVRVSMAVEQDEVKIYVEDTGIGIAPEHLTRIFERFYRVDPGRSRETGGTGLGLAIVKHMVHAHAGRIDVHSEPGKGSVFTISLPLA